MALHIEDVDLGLDASLVDRSRLGDPSAFEELYRRHHDRLHRYCVYQLRNRHDAEDVVQEAFARAWRSLPTFAGDKFYPWLRVIARNLCADTGRRRARVEPQAEIDLGFADGADADLAHQADLEMLRTAMDRLPDRHRTALEWREQEELSYEEIAQRAGVSIATVESLLWRARQGLKRQFEMVAGPERYLAGVPGVGWVLVRVRRLHTRASGLASRWSSPIVGLGNFATIGAVGVVGAVAGSLGGPAQAVAIAPAQAQMTLTSSQNASPGQGSGLAAGVAPASSAPSVTAAAPATSVSHQARVVLANPLTTGTAAHQEATHDPISVGAGGVWLGADPVATGSYVKNVVTQQLPTALGGSHG